MIVVFIIIHPSLLLLVSFQNIDTSLLNILRTNDLNNCQPTKRSKVNYITVKKHRFCHFINASFFLLFCSSLFVVIMFLVWCDRPEIILKEPVDVENTWSTTHLFVIGNNKNGKVFVTWNISHGRSIIFHKMKKKKNACSTKWFEWKIRRIMCVSLHCSYTGIFVHLLSSWSLFFWLRLRSAFYIIRIFFTIQNESKLSFEKSAALIIRLLASPLG